MEDLHYETPLVIIIITELLLESSSRNISKKLHHYVKPLKIIIITEHFLLSEKLSLQIIITELLVEKS